MAFDISNQSPVQLANYDNSWFRPGGSLLRRSAWFFFGEPIVRSAWIPSSGLRVALLRLFGARIGNGVVIKPSVSVKYPWHLVIGDHCWIGEHVWIDNLTTVRIESNVCISQGAYLCTGNHDWTDPHFGLMIAPIHLGEGSWAGAKSILTPGSLLGRGAIAAAGAVITGVVPDLEIYAGNPAIFVKKRVICSTSTASPTPNPKSEQRVQL
jgi:putative colanic acid biosynthesis acetyltransferase WcaF